MVIRKQIRSVLNFLDLVFLGLTLNHYIIFVCKLVFSLLQQKLIDEKDLLRILLHDHNKINDLTVVAPILFREYLVANRRNEINKLINAQIHIRIFNLNQEINDQSNIDNFDEYTNDILVDNHEIGNGAFRSLSTLLKKLIPIWKMGENPIITPGDTLYIKLGGDGRNVGRKQNHVMITFCLLNEGNEVLKPDHQFR